MVHGCFTLSGRAWMVYAVLVVAPFVVSADRFLLFSPVFLTVLPMALFLVWRFAKAQTGRDYNRLLLGTISLHTLYAIAVVIGLLI